jgi:ankyrin repeat protein
MSRQVVPEANPPELSLGPAEEPPAEGAKQWGVKEKPPPVRCLIAMNKDLQNAYRDEVLEDFQLRVGRQVRPRFRLFEFIRKLIRKNPNSNKKKKQYFDACLMNNMQLAERLLLKGLYPHTHDANGCNGLYYACIEGSFDTARMLLQNEVSTATVNALDKSTPLHLACRGGNSGYELLVDLLLGTRKVDVDAKDCRGMTPAMWAAQRNNYRPIAALAEFGADLDAQDSEGWTALHYAAYYGYKKTANELLEEGAHYSIADKLDQTPWDWAMKRKFDSIAAALDDHARKIRRFKEKYGYSP